MGMFSFLNPLRRRVSSIEDGAKECVENYFNQLYTSLDKALGEEQKEQKERIVDSLEAQKQSVFESISSSFSGVISSRMSNSDEEYREIQGLPDGPIKKEIKKDFEAVVFQEGLDKLCEDMKQSVMKVCNKLNKKLHKFVAGQQKLVDYYAQSLEKMEKIKSSEAGKQRLVEIQNEQAELVKRVETVKQQARERIDELEKSIRNLATQTDASDSENG